MWATTGPMPWRIKAYRCNSECAQYLRRSFVCFAPNFPCHVLLENAQHCAAGINHPAMFDSSLRVAKDRWLRPSAQALRGIPPLAITFAGFVAGMAAAWSAARGHYWGALALFWLGRIFDGLDGAVARATDSQSALGGYLDLMADFVVYAAIPIGLWWGLRNVNGPLPLIVMLATFYVNAASWMLLSALVEKGDALTSLAMPKGIIEGFETIVFYSLFLLFPAWSNELYYLFAFLVAVSCLQRIVWVARNLKTKS
jgi:phosphatidylglycerophosphate synthase